MIIPIGGSPSPNRSLAACRMIASRLLGEVQAVGKGNEQRAFYAQLEGRVIDGIYLLTEYNFHDPDWAHKTGAEQFYRFSCEFFPVPFVEIRPSATLAKAIGQSKFTSKYLHPTSCELLGGWMTDAKSIAALFIVALAVMVALQRLQ